MSDLNANGEKQRQWFVIKTPSGFMCGFECGFPVLNHDKKKALRYGKKTAQQQALIFNEYEVINHD